MAIIKPTYGAIANDGTGQTLRAAIERISNNYDEFYLDGTLFIKQVAIAPAGATPNYAEILAAVVTAPSAATNCIYLLQDSTNNVTWFCSSDGTNYNIVQLSRIR
jgi:hypothetical protein